MKPEYLWTLPAVAVIVFAYYGIRASICANRIGNLTRLATPEEWKENDYYSGRCTIWMIVGIVTTVVCGNIIMALTR